MPLATAIPTTNPTVDFTKIKMVWAVYYPWYRDRDVFASNVLDKVLSNRTTLLTNVNKYWTNNLKFKDRPLGPLDMQQKGMISYDPIAIRNQVEQAMSAGIDGFLPYYRGKTHFTHGATNLLFDVAKKIKEEGKGDFRIGLHVSPQGAIENQSLGNTPVDLLVSWITDYVQTFQNHPQIMKLNSKPLAIVYSTGLFQPYEWEQVKSKLAAKNISVYLVADNGSSNSFDQYIPIFDGCVGRNISAEKGILRAKQISPKLWLGEVKPGFDNSERNAPKTSKFIDRQDGVYLNKMFDEAVAHNPQWLRVVSWNEYYEHTHIEPSVLYGQKYLNIVRDRIKIWKSKILFP
jgi:hypothetical protein